MDEILQAIIQEHSKRPRHYHKQLCPPAGCHLAVNPLCGDELTLFVTAEPGGLVVSFEGAGCAVSQASASLLAECCQGKTWEETLEWGASLSAALENGAMPKAPLPASLEHLFPLQAFPRRVPCALLAWQALAAIAAQREQAGQ
jgi:nitrogen fixation protein NifU and related proteins